MECESDSLTDDDETDDNFTEPDVAMSDIYLCPLCDESFTTRGRVQYHALKEHGGFKLRISQVYMYTYRNT